MTSQPPNNSNKNNQPSLPDVGDRSTTAAFRCPAGSHIGMNMTAPKLSEVSKSFRSTDLSQSAVSEVGDSSRSTADHPATGTGSSSSVQQLSTQETERARIEARKHHKRITDAIYARRRRLREKEDEKQLVRETEQTQRENKRLRQENNALQTMLDRAAVQIEARGDADRKWLQEVFAKTAATPVAEVAATTAAAADSNAERSRRPPPPETASPKKQKRSHVRPTPPEPAAVKPSSSRTTIAEEHGPPPHQLDPPRSNHLRLEEEMEALRQASYLQGLQDAALLQQQQQQPRSAAVRDSLWLAEPPLRNDSRTIEQLYLARRLQALGAYPTSSSTTTNNTEHSLSSILRPELTSFLEQRRALQSSSSIVNSLFPRTTTTTTDATILAAAALERYRNQTAASRLGLNATTTTTALRSSLYPPPSRQWPLTQQPLGGGLWNTNHAWDDRVSSSSSSNGLATSLFLPSARDPSLSLQLAARLQLLASSPPSSTTNSGLPGDATPSPLPRLNFPPL